MLGHPATLFAADKVWISSGSRGPQQIEASRTLWGVRRFDLLQVHTCSTGRTTCPHCFARSRGRVRYVGVTTSEGRRHGEMEKIMRSQPIDFVSGHLQRGRSRGRGAHPAARPRAPHRGHCNRPSGRGAHSQVERHSLPAWASALGASSWAQLPSQVHRLTPAITCAIPATSKVAHVVENLSAAAGTLPDAELRRRMAAYVESL